MQNLLKTALLVLVLAGLAAPRAQAQDDRAGTATATHLLVPTTARAVGLGAGLSSGLQGMNGVEAAFYNPASLTINSQTSVLLSRLDYAADIGVNTLGFAQRFGNNQLGLTLTSWDYGEIPYTTESSPEITNRTFEPSTIVLGLTYARQFTDRISAGVTLNGMTEDIDDTNQNGIAFNAGMTYVVGESGLRFGVALMNFGPKMSFDGNGLNRRVTFSEDRADVGERVAVVEADAFELPSLLNFSLAYTRDLGSSASATVLGTFRSNQYDQDHFIGGLELGFQDLFYVRGGYQYMSDMDVTMYTGFNVGAGLNVDIGGTVVAVDYALRTVDYFSNPQIFTASVTL